MTSDKSRLILFPVPMGDTPVDRVLPAANIELLRQVKYFVVENIRSARRFLRAASRDIVIDELHFEELSEHTPASAVDEMLRPMLEGHDIGVISEAGCPAVADPGADIVAAAQRRGLTVVPLVGPSSIIMALMGSGSNGQSFAFNGYLPIEPPKRRHAIADMERHANNNGQSQIFIETPYRNNRLIDDLLATMSPSTRLCIASDITGPGQSIITDTVGGWRKRPHDYGKVPTIFVICS